MTSEYYPTFQQVLTAEFSKPKSYILQTACKLFMQQGYHGTSLNKIAELSNHPTSTLYHYFSAGKKTIAHTLIVAIIKYCRAVIFNPLKTKFGSYEQNIANFSHTIQLFCDCQEIKLVYSIPLETEAFKQEIVEYFALWRLLIIGLLYADEISSAIDYELIHRTISFLHGEHLFINTLKISNNIASLLQGLTDLWKSLLGETATLLMTDTNKIDRA